MQHRLDDELRAIARTLPLDRLLVETDAPYLAPQAWRGKRNEPAYTAHTARVGAELFGLDYADFAAQIDQLGGAPQSDEDWEQLADFVASTLCDGLCPRQS
mgnify:CR=1 FL=1